MSTRLNRVPHLLPPSLSPPPPFPRSSHGLLHLLVHDALHHRCADEIKFPEDFNIVPVPIPPSARCCRSQVLSVARHSTRSPPARLDIRGVRSWSRILTLCIRCGVAAGREESEMRASKKPKVVDESPAIHDSDSEGLKIFLSSKKSVPKTEATEPNIPTIILVHRRAVYNYAPHAVLLPPPDVPRDGKYKFCNRAKAFVDSGHRIFNANKGGEDEGVGGVTEGAACMDLNGTGDGCHHG
ncbi:hypothetical protein C8F04DRAFT_1302130 [Mycena alexandri]|uniref:Uncharacterized protein n=1 Tax=Mycena alexandri TaxID=1745969 RepID=A0AAD6TA77_9AGAR|nr:hypothetical protein C8F04DRAFT_1302130 [Mycena alexandri]